MENAVATRKFAVPPVWKNTNNCSHCSASFRPFPKFCANPRHHCRNCGGAFCGRCSIHSVMIEELGFNRPVRVCQNCFETLKRVQDANAAQRLTSEPTGEVSYRSRDWRCTRCTQLNPGTIRNCISCDTAVIDDWECPACMARSSLEHSFCKECRTRRPKPKTKIILKKGEWWCFTCAVACPEAFRFCATCGISGPTAPLGIGPGVGGGESEPVWIHPSGDWECSHCSSACSTDHAYCWCCGGRRNPQSSRARGQWRCPSCSLLFVASNVHGGDHPPSNCLGCGYTFRHTDNSTRFLQSETQLSRIRVENETRVTLTSVQSSDATVSELASATNAEESGHETYSHQSYSY